MSRTSENPLTQDTHLVAAPIENMATAIEEIFVDGSDAPLRQLVQADRPRPLQSALEEWIIEQLDLEDPEIANAIFQVLIRRVQRRAGFQGG